MDELKRHLFFENGIMCVKHELVPFSEVDTSVKVYASMHMYFTIIRPYMN